MRKPKGKTPSLISGKKPKKVLVKKSIKCARCRELIAVNAICIGVPNIRIKFLSSIKKYCKLCFEKIINQTEYDLGEAKALLHASDDAENGGDKL